MISSRPQQDHRAKQTDRQNQHDCNRQRERVKLRCQNEIYQHDCHRKGQHQRTGGLRDLRSSGIAFADLYAVRQLVLGNNVVNGRLNGIAVTGFAFTGDGYGLLLILAHDGLRAELGVDIRHHGQRYGAAGHGRNLHGAQCVQTGCYILVAGNGNVVFLTVHAERGCGRAGQLTTNQTANGGRIQTEARRILAVDLNGNTRGLLACRGLNIDGIRQGADLVCQIVCRLSQLVVVIAGQLNADVRIRGHRHGAAGRNRQFTACNILQVMAQLLGDIR